MFTSTAARTPPCCRKTTGALEASIRGLLLVAQSEWTGMARHAQGRKVRSLRRNRSRRVWGARGASAARRDRPQRLQVCVLVRLVEDQTDFLRARLEEAPHLIAALPGRAEDGHGVDHLVGDELRGAVALAGLERGAHAVGLSAEADPAHVLVVEDAHAADVEGDVRALTVARGLH